MTHRTNAARRGLSMVFAVMTLGLLGMTLSAIATRVVLQQRRTVAAVEEAQTAQLLAAGVRVAETQAATPVDGPVPTPVGTLTLAWSGEPGRRACAVEAAYGHGRRAVTLRFEGTRAIAVER